MGDNRQRMPKRLTDKWRAKVAIGSILHRVNQQALGNVEMTPNSLKAALKLIDKFLPNLQQVSAEHLHEHTHSVRHIEIAPVKAIQHDPAPALIEAEYTEVDKGADPLDVVLVEPHNAR